MSKTKKRTGKFIIFEGLDGSGKTTALQKALYFLASENKFKSVNFKGVASNTKFGKKIKPKYSTFWFLVDLWFLTRELIKPSLKRKYNVLQDKYYLYLMAHYPDNKKIFNKLWLWFFQTFLLKKPDLIIFFDVEDDIRRKRLKKDINNKHHIELASNPELLAKRKLGYMRCLQKHKDIVVRIDTSHKDIHTVGREVANIIKKEVRRG